MARVKILPSYCKGCELCIASCPKGVLFLSEEVNARGHRVVAVRQDVACTGCGNCATICPDAAVVLYEEAQVG